MNTYIPQNNIGCHHSSLSQILPFGIERLIQNTYKAFVHLASRLADCIDIFHHTRPYVVRFRLECQPPWGSIYWWFISMYHIYCCYTVNSADNTHYYNTILHIVWWHQVQVISQIRILTYKIRSMSRPPALARQCLCENFGENCRVITNFD